MRAGAPSPVGTLHARCDRSERACGPLSLPSAPPGGCAVSSKCFVPRCGAWGQVHRLRGPAGEAELGPDLGEGQASPGSGVLHAPLAHSLCPALCLGTGRPRWRLQPRGWEPADGAVARRPVTAAGAPGVPPLSRTRTLCPSEASPAPAASATPGFAQDPSSGPGRSPVLTCPPVPVLTVTRALAGVSANT